MRQMDMLKVAMSVNPREVDWSSFKPPTFATAPQGNSLGTQFANLAKKPFRLGGQLLSAAWNGHDGGPSILGNFVTHSLNGDFIRSPIKGPINSIMEPLRRARPAIGDELERGNELFRTVGTKLMEPINALKTLRSPQFAGKY